MIHEIAQNTDEWLEARHGVVTASNFATIMANYGKPFGNPAIQYAMKVAIEGKTNRSIEGFKNEWMDRGIELEDDARQLYSDMTFTPVQDGKFWTIKGDLWKIDRFGASPDGLAGDGLIEIKCPKYSTHFNQIIKGGYDLSYQWQIRGQMWITDRDWCDFVSYCPDFPLDKQLYIFRVERDQEEEDKMISRLNEFVTVVDSYILHLK